MLACDVWLKQHQMILCNTALWTAKNPLVLPFPLYPQSFCVCKVFMQDPCIICYLCITKVIAKQFIWACDKGYAALSRDGQKGYCLYYWFFFVFKRTPEWKFWSLQTGSTNEKSKNANVRDSYSVSVNDHVDSHFPPHFERTFDASLWTHYG